MCARTARLCPHRAPAARYSLIGSNSLNGSLAFEMRYLSSPLPRETYPTVERRRALFTAFTRPDTDGVTQSLNRLAQASFFFDKKARKPHPMRLTLTRIGS